jgi:hypothetical protein
VFEPRGGSQLHALTFSFHHETERLWPKRDRWCSKAFSQEIQGQRQHNDAEKDGSKITP